MVPHFQTFTALQPSEYHQRNAHTAIFNIFEYGNRPSEIQVKEIDDAAYPRKKDLEAYVTIEDKDPMDGDSRPSWPSTSADGSDYPSMEHLSRATMALIAMLTPILRTKTLNQSQFPSLSLLGCCTHFLSQDREHNAEILHVLSASSASSRSDLNAESLDQGTLAQRSAARQEIPDDSNRSLVGFGASPPALIRYLLIT